MKKCPYCAEDIQDDAVLCKHCHSSLNLSPAEYSAHSNSSGSKSTISLDSINVLKTKYTIISLIFNALALISLFVPFISLNISAFGFSVIAVSVSPLLGIGTLLQLGETSKTIEYMCGSNPFGTCFGITTMVGFVLFIISLCAIINTIRALVNWRDSSESIQFFKSSITLIATINGLSFLTAIIANATINFENDLLSANIYFPSATMIFLIISIVFAVLITNFHEKISSAEEYMKRRHRQPNYWQQSKSQHSSPIWICKSCGEENSSSSVFCIQCGMHK